MDAVGGLWTANLGHAGTPVKEAIAGQSDQLHFRSIFRGRSHDAVIEAGRMLEGFLGPVGMRRAFFTSGGSASVEVALRPGRQNHGVRGDAG